MSAHQQVALAQLDTQAFALMSRLHVILRREGGRVTDIEYMRMNPDYCRHVLELAERMPTEALPEICQRLREVFFGPAGLFVVEPSRPLLAARATTAPVTPPSAAALDAAEAPPARIPAVPENPGQPVQAYVGRLR